MFILEICRQKSKVQPWLWVWDYQSCNLINLYKVNRCILNDFFNHDCLAWSLGTCGKQFFTNGSDWSCFYLAKPYFKSIFSLVLSLWLLLHSITSGCAEGHYCLIPPAYAEWRWGLGHIPSGLFLVSSIPWKSLEGGQSWGQPLWWRIIRPLEGLMEVQMSRGTAFVLVNVCVCSEAVFLKLRYACASLGISLKCRFWSRSSGVGSEIVHF